MLLYTPLSFQLKRLSKTCPALNKQFIPSKIEGTKESKTFIDPLLEDEYTVRRGLVHKYGNRALVLLTMNCAAYCRFCTRRRMVSDVQKGVVTVSDLNKMVAYVKKHQEIKELIFSGGDPLTVPGLLKIALKKLGGLPQIKIIRVGTRMHLANPALVNNKVLEALRMVKNKPLYLMVHFEHPSELTPATKRAVKKLQSVSTMVLSQSVSLRAVNDSVKVLYDLFSGLIEIGVKPYYLYRCDLVK
ncbi:MAG: 4Fe-4S cluster-binding domain-containing protein, partial [Candidatus Magasanikbacteria bacterium]|nr:4Fe-4S cluster-binding domain-containing protein [Candidatus Magasanikbacteria bacterium]